MDLGVPVLPNPSGMASRTEKHKLIVTQANALALAAYRMTLQEKRLLLLLIAQVRMEDEDFKIYHISIPDIQHYLGIESTNYYSRLRSLTKKLLSRVLDVPNDEGGWEQFQWVSKCSYKPKTNRRNGINYLEMQLHPDLRPFLLDLKARFGSVPLDEIAIMSSVHAIRLFEILYYGSMGFSKKTLYFDLLDLKKRLGVEEKKSYVNSAVFRREILDKAQEECAAKSPLIFTYAPMKTGNKVSGFEFQIKRNQRSGERTVQKRPAVLEAPQQNLPLPSNKITSKNLSEDQIEALKFMEENGVGKNTALKYLTEFKPDHCIRNSRLARERFAQYQARGKEATLAKLTHTAIKDDWGVAQLAPYEKEQKEKKEQAGLRNRRYNGALQYMIEIFREFQSCMRNMVLDRYEQLSTREQGVMKTEFENTPGVSEMGRKTFRKFGFVRKYKLKEAAGMIAFSDFLIDRSLKPSERDFVAWTKKQKKVVLKDFGVGETGCLPIDWTEKDYSAKESN